MIDEPDNNFDSMSGQKAFRKLRLFSAGSRQFGVFEDEIVAVADWRQPAPLPQAPESILGVVSVQGRMLTVLDLAKIAGCEVEANIPPDDRKRQILTLGSDEQLALVIDVLGETTDIEDGSFPIESERGNLVLTVLKQGENEINILRVPQLFPYAIQGRERRRRRF